MIINNNIPALNTYRQMGINQKAGSNAMEKLSSGLRINKAGDDAAGLAISEKMRAQVRGLDQANRNSQDGISMIQTAEGALQETHNILQRMRELATQAANDTNVSVDREEIQKEMNQLTSEINRIGNTTEFNTQSLLKGKNAEVKEAAAAQTTIKAGEAGVAAGAISNLTVNQKSIVGEASKAVVQGKTSLATGAVGATAQTTASVKGQKAEANVLGLTFKSTDATNALNGKTIKISQQAGAGAAGAIVDDGTGNIEFKIGTDSSGKSLFKGTTVGELANYLKDTATNFGGSITSKVTIIDPTGPATGQPVVGLQDSNNVAVAQTYATSQLTGGETETRGVNTFTITNKIDEAGDTITVGGKTFTAVASGADASKGQFNMDAIHSYATAAGVVAEGTDLNALMTTNTLDDNEIKITVGTTDFKINDASLKAFTGGTKEDLVNFLKNADTVGDGTGTKLSTVADISIGADNKIQILNKTAGTDNVVVTLTGEDKAHLKTLTGFNDAAATTGTAGATTGATEADQARSLRLAINSNSDLNTRFTASGSGTAGEVVLKENAGQATGEALEAVTTAGSGKDNKLIISDLTGKNLKEIKIQQAGGDTLAVASNVDGSLTISLANANAYKNTAAEIEKAIKALGTQNGVDYTKYTVESTGSWDTDEVGNNITKADGTLVGGLEEKKGDYSLNLTKAFAAGDIVEIAGQTFKAVESDAIASRGEFNVSGGNINTQASELRNAIALNDALKQSFNIQGSGTEIKLVEKEATGKDLKQSDLDVRAAGTQGEFAVKVDDLLESGAKFVLDGEEITVSDKNAHVGYDNGTAIKESGDLASQTKAIVDAINTNKNLSKKYTASVGEDGSLSLKQKEDFATDKAPEISTKNSPLGNFTASFQIGANSGQSMTIEIGDMRANALGVSGDGSNGEISAKNGKVASFVETANVTDGTNNKNTEFALDISTHEKASAAISVINDAIESISAQRSNLGAFQNRLEHTISNLGNASENLQAAESRVRDVDMAKEVMEMTRANILGQASQAMLAQANQKPQSVLQLLG